MTEPFGWRSMRGLVLDGTVASMTGPEGRSMPPRCGRTSFTGFVGGVAWGFSKVLMLAVEESLCLGGRVVGGLRTWCPIAGSRSLGGRVVTEPFGWRSMRGLVLDGTVASIAGPDGRSMPPRCGRTSFTGALGAVGWGFSKVCMLAAEASSSLGGRSAGAVPGAAVGVRSGFVTSRSV
ncbi:MAG: hypothetical protein JRI25_28100 [Deltaproteobacteria bacterium]|nr:hypothetical protein [Deltaproteobacteria bacterium]